MMEARRASRAGQEGAQVNEARGPCDTPSAVETTTPRPPLPPARAELRTAIELLAEAQHEAEVAAAPARRLGAVVHELAVAETELASARSSDERELGQWLAGGAKTPRPQPSPAALEAEKRLAQLVRDGAAARQALPMAETVHRTAVERLTRLGAARRDAGYRAAVEAAKDYLDGPFTAALIAFLHCENRARSLEAALRIAGQGSDPSSTALACSVALGEMIVAAKRSGGVPHDFQSGRLMLERLMTDPEATLK